MKQNQYDALKERKTKLISCKKQTLDVVALGNSIGTGKKGVTAEVLLVNSFDELEKKKDEVKGKIVFYNYKFNDTYVNTFLSYSDAANTEGKGPAVQQSMELRQ